MNKTKNIIKWFFITLGIVLCICWLVSTVVKTAEIVLNFDFDFEFEFKCILSCALVAVYFMGIRGSLNHIKPIEDKKKTKTKRIIGWILVVLSIIGIVISILSLIGNFHMVQNIITQNGEQGDNYLTNTGYNGMFLDFAGRDIVFSGLIFAWGYYLIKCGPLYSPIWKRILKVVLYSVATCVLLGYASTNTFTGWFELLIVFLVMLILVIITTDYVKEPEARITEDVEL